MHKYHHVSKTVEPKKVRLAGANAELEVTRRDLAKSKQQLKEVRYIIYKIIDSSVTVSLYIRTRLRRTVIRT